MAHCSIPTYHMCCRKFTGIGHCILLIISEDTINYLYSCCLLWWSSSYWYRKNSDKTAHIPFIFFLSLFLLSLSDLCLTTRFSCRELVLLLITVSDTHTYRVSQEERTKLREGVPYVKLYRYNPKHLCPKLNGFRDNGKW